jgi:hypothetical protein
MKVEFVRSGGFAGRSLAVTLDTDTMPAAAAADLVTKIEAADFFSLPAAAADGGTRRDAFHYTLTVTTPERRHTVEVWDDAAPALQSLLDYLVSTARAARLRGP